MDAARPSLTLHGSKTSRAFRAHWCLRELGLDYELNLISGRGGGTVTPEFLAINPKGQIPFLEDRATDVVVPVPDVEVAVTAILVVVPVTVVVPSTFRVVHTPLTAPISFVLPALDVFKKHFPNTCVK